MTNSLIDELTKVKSIFQQRAICAAMGINISETSNATPNRAMDYSATFKDYEGGDPQGLGQFRMGDASTRKDGALVSDGINGLDRCSDTSPDRPVIEVQEILGASLIGFPSEISYNKCPDCGLDRLRRHKDRRVISFKRW